MAFLHCGCACVLRSHDRENLSSHTEHVNGISPVWILVCALSSPITCWLASRALRALGARQHVIGLCLKVRRSEKTFAAHCASEGFFSSVDSHMYLKVRGSGKSSVTNGASLRFFTSMGPHMFIKGQRLGKIVATDWASEEFFSSMDIHVCLKGRRSGKYAETYSAPK